MKKLLSFFSLLLAIFTMQAQTVIFTDNFDSYTAGQRLCSQNNNDWTTWSNSPGSAEDAYISTEQAASGSNSLKINGSNDIIYRFSNQTSGVFDIEFKYYVPSTGNGAYFNLQHYYNPGIEWAFECFLYNSGSGYVTINNANTNFSYPSNAWFPVKIHVDLDNSSATLTINSVDVITWPFNYTSENANGINQLGSVNFYAGAPDNNLTGTYYVDDFAFTQVTAGNDGHFVFTPNTDIVGNYTENTTAVETINMSNPGGTPVNYRIVPTYNITPNSASQGETALMRYNGEISSGIIFSSTSAEAAIGYNASEIVSRHLVGKTLNRVEVYLENVDGMLNPQIRIYDMNGILVDGPGEIAYQQNFNPVDGLNTIYLNTPYILDGRDLWIGVYFEQTEATAASETRPSFICDDATMPDPYGNWCKTTVAWSHLNDNSELTYNWAITGYVDGTPIEPWMTILPNSQGTINANGSAVANVNIAVGAAGTVQSGKLHIFSNDLSNATNVINVNITSITVGIDENNQIDIRIFPNPTTDALHISSESINHVEVYNMAGQCLLNSTYAENDITVNTSNWAPGTYMVKVTANGTSKIEKVIVR